MNKLDSALLTLLVKDGRMSYAEMARELDISRAHARDRVHQLVESGVIEQFTAVIDPSKLGKVISTFVDLKVAPYAIEAMATELAECQEVINLYIMSDLRSLHMHTLTESQEAFERFARERLLGREAVISIDCTTLLSRIKHGRGGAKL